MNANEAMGQDSTFEEAPELSPDETGQASTSRERVELGQEGLEVLSQELVEHGFLRAAPTVSSAEGFSDGLGHPAPTGPAEAWLRNTDSRTGLPVACAALSGVA